MVNSERKAVLITDQAKPIGERILAELGQLFTAPEIFEFTHPANIRYFASIGGKRPGVVLISTETNFSSEVAVNKLCGFLDVLVEHLPKESRSQIVLQSADVSREVLDRFLESGVAVWVSDTLATEYLSDVVAAVIQNRVFFHPQVVWAGRQQK